ncbi:hypothetical protein ABIE49_002560 [Bradyrhizobium sp. OAE829]
MQAFGHKGTIQSFEGLVLFNREAHMKNQRQRYPTSSSDPHLCRLRPAG